MHLISKIAMTLGAIIFASTALSATVGASALSAIAAHVEHTLACDATTDVADDAARMKALFADYRAQLAIRGLAANG